MLIPVDTEEEQREILHRRLQDRLHDYRKQLADWHDKLEALAPPCVQSSKREPVSQRV